MTSIQTNRISACISGLAIALFSLLSMGCDSKSDLDITSKSQNLVPNNQMLGIFQVKRTAKDTTILHKEIKDLAEILTGTSVALADVAADSSVANRRSHFKVKNKTNLRATYTVQFDTLKIINHDILVMTQAPDSATIVDKTVAVAAMDKVFADLVTREIIDARHYAQSEVRTAYHRMSIGKKGVGDQKQWIEQYFFTRPRMINGIPLLNAYVTIGIHRTGKTSKIEVCNLDVQSKWEESKEVPVDPSAVVTKAVSAEAARNRFKVEIDKGNFKILRQRLAYVVVGDAGKQIAQPMHIFLYSPRFTTRNGKKVHGFLENVGLGVVDLSVKPIFFTKYFAESKQKKSPTPSDIKAAK